MIDAGEVVAELAVAAEADAMREASDWLLRSLQQLGARDPLPFRFDVCAGEALANVIQHAHPGGGTHRIVLRLLREGPVVSLQIEDDGIPFDPLEAPEREAPRRLADAAIGGLGLKLIRKMMEQCEYARRDGRNVLRMSATLRS
jgi:serine/threonine-protein kinase RsbW